MKKQIDAQDISASPLYNYGPRLARIGFRLAMLALIAGIFLSPAALYPKYLKAQTCPAGEQPCGQNAPPGKICVNGCTAPAGGANVPEMPALLVPLFLAVGGGVAYRVRRKHLAQSQA